MKHEIYEPVFIYAVKKIPLRSTRPQVKPNPRGGRDLSGAPIQMGGKEVT